MQRRIVKLRENHGFSLVELIVSLLITLIVLAAAVTVFTGALRTRERQSARTVAITAAQAALTVMSREIGNSGFGLETSGLVLVDTDIDSLRFRANINNTGTAGADTSQPGEDVMYYFDDTSNSVVRFDRNANGGAGATSGVINRVSDVDFVYDKYGMLQVDCIAPDAWIAAENICRGPTPSENVGRVRITLKVFLLDISGQPSGRIEQVTSEITLRNSPYMLGQY